MFRREALPNFYAIVDALRWAGRRVRPFLLGLAFLLLLADVVANARAGRALEQELQHARAEGAPLSLREAAPPPVPDDENAALVYEQAFQRLPRLRSTALAGDRKQQRLAEEDEQVVQAFVSPDPRQRKNISLAKVRQALAGTDEALDRVRKAAAMPRCRFPVNWEAGAGALFPHLPKLASLSRLLAAHAILASSDRKPEEAVADIDAILGIARHIRAEPILISQLIGYSCLSVACNSQRRVMEIVPLTVAENHRLDRAWAEIDLYDPFERSLESERCLGLWAFDLLRSDPGSWAARLGIDSDPLLTLSSRLGPLGALPRQWDEICYLRTLGQEISRAKEREGAPDRPDADIRFPWYAAVSRLLTPAYSACRTKCNVTQAKIGLARWGLAIDEYRQHTGHFPETLRAVEEGRSARLPVDPFTGEALRYRRNGEGYVLYSVGLNRRDDQGQSGNDRTHTETGLPPPPGSQPDDIAWWFDGPGSSSG